MELHLPSYYRARIETFLHFISKELPGHSIHDTGKKNSPLELLKQGFIHPEIKERFESSVASYTGIKLPDNPLTFTELCSFNTWFAMHPEKIAGVEFVTTSFQFPLTIKGTKDDIIRVVSAGFSDDRDKRIRIARARAIAKLKILQLIDLDN